MLGFLHYQGDGRGDGTFYQNISGDMSSYYIKGELVKFKIKGNISNLQMNANISSDELDGLITN